jgi:LPXTG-site transpeptidase (sortase) family protein
MNRFEPSSGQSGGQPSPRGDWRQRLAGRLRSLAPRQRVAGWFRSLPARQRLADWLLALPPRQRQAVLIGAPLLAIVIIAVAVTGVILAISGGGDEKQATAKATATSSAPSGQGEGLLQEEITQMKKLEQELLAQRGTSQGISGTNPDAPVPGGEGDRLIIPKIEVDAPMTMRVVGSDGVMQNPVGPEDVVWYDFSAISGLGGRPGVGGNTVLSGHVDYHDYGPAVFWDLRNLEPGDEITIHLRDGSEYKYAVEWNRTINPAAISWNDVVAATPQESVTMITCAGTFDSSTRSYDQRRVIWAVRVS